MTFSEYREYVRKFGHFCVRLGDNRTELRIPDAACELVIDKWLTPLLTVARSVYIYRRTSKDHPYDVTPPPRGSRPAILTKTVVRMELDAKRMLAVELRKYWWWALRHTNITLIVPPDAAPVEMLAKESWDPAILTNLGAVVARGSIELAKREAKKENACFIFYHMSSDVHCNIFAPSRELLKFYECFVVNCRFILKGLERELMPVRQKQK